MSKDSLLCTKNTDRIETVCWSVVFFTCNLISSVICFKEYYIYSYIYIFLRALHLEVQTFQPIAHIRDAVAQLWAIFLNAVFEKELPCISYTEIKASGSVDCII